MYSGLMDDVRTCVDLGVPKNVPVFAMSEESVPHIELAAGLNLNAMSVGPGIDIGNAKELVQGKTCLLGNLEPIEIFMNSDAEMVAKETYRIMNAAKVDGGYMFNTGEMNPRDVPVQNMEAMIKSAKENSKY
jgi:[methyl-Co(III) methanol-specific corrinoid protein]:coenzyme M methyltransferase